MTTPSMNTDVAIALLEAEVCPIDGSRTSLDYDYDNSGYHWYAQCSGPDRHIWPFMRDGGEYVPDPELVDERLERDQ